MALCQKYLSVLESLDWQVLEYEEDGRVTIQKYSPAGEDFSICVETNNFSRSVAEYAAQFDIEEHVSMWVVAKINGTRGVPSVIDLVDDAREIDAMLEELADKLYEVK